VVGFFCEQASLLLCLYHLAIPPAAGVGIEPTCVWQEQYLDATAYR
jgi:hypothetical protein